VGGIGIIIWNRLQLKNQDPSSPAPPIESLRLEVSAVGAVARDSTSREIIRFGQASGFNRDRSQFMRRDLAGNHAPILIATFVSIIAGERVQASTTDLSVVAERRPILIQPAFAIHVTGFCAERGAGKKCNYENE